jgi:hypothetical protein
MNVFIRHRWKVSKRLAAFRFTPISRHCELVVLNLLCDWPAGNWHRGPMAQVMNDDIEAALLCSAKPCPGLLSRVGCPFEQRSAREP